MDEDREDKVIMLAENKQQGENTISKPSWCAEMLSQIHKVIFVSEGKLGCLSCNWHNAPCANIL